MGNSGYLSGQERVFSQDEVIVSKTDLTGRITYANRVFMRLAGMGEKELLGQPHSIIRHPHMPRTVFKLLWDTIGQGEEIFAYVLNRAKNGDHYWVFAHVTPSFNEFGQVTGYHSHRRSPDMRIVRGTIEPLYRALLEEESRHRNAKEGMNAAAALLGKVLAEKGVTYPELVFSLRGEA